MTINDFTRLSHDKMDLKKVNEVFLKTQLQLNLKATKEKLQPEENKADFMLPRK